jgi:hypothetical protein
VQILIKVGIFNIWPEKSQKYYVAVIDDFYGPELAQIGRV